MTTQTLNADIVIPAPISEAARQLAGKLGVSVGEFYTAALSAYVVAVQKRDVTEALNEVYETEPSTIDPVLANLQTASLGGEKW
jgi:predicted RecB family endonuclease